MLKNTAGQKVGVQMVTAADGTAFTGAVTVAVTVDAGAQATGSVGSGACAHEGNGYHTYAPAQAETNGDLLAFTFTGTGAIPSTIQVYTAAGDAFTRLGAPAGASVSADIAAAKAQIAAIEADTQDLQSRTPAALVNGRTDASVGAMASGVLTATAIAANAIAAAKIAADAITAIQSGLATAAELAKVPKSDSNVTWNATAAAQLQSEAGDALTAYDPPTRAEATSDANALAGLINDLGTVVDGLATSLAALDAAVTAIKGKTDNLAFTVAGQVDANTKSLNDAALTGDGSAGSKWGPA